MYSYTVPLIATGYSENFKSIKGFRKVKVEVMVQNLILAQEATGWLLLWLEQILEENHSVCLCFMYSLVAF